MKSDRQVARRLDAARRASDCYHSREYVAALAIRLGVSSADLIIIEGYDGPRPE